jgi:hypothetical protein
MDEQSTTPVQFLRDIAARQASLRALAAAHDRFATVEQVKWAEGDETEAEGAHKYANWVLRAYRAEMDDPEPAA